MLCDDRECHRHNLGRRFADPTRIQDSKRALMAVQGAVRGQVPTHADTGRSRTTDFQGLVTGAGSCYNLRSGQPRHTLPLRGQGRLQGRRGGQQGQDEVVWADDDADGCEVDITSGSGTDDSEATVNGDDPDGAIRGRHSPGDDGRAPEQRRSLRGDEVAPELHQSNLAGDVIVTEAQRRSLIGDVIVTPDRRQSNLAGDVIVTGVQRRSLIGSTHTAPDQRLSRLAGDLKVTEERRRPGAAAAGLDEYGTGVSPTSSSLSSDVNRSDVDYGVKPHSSCLSSDVNCSDSVDYSRIQRVMDVVRHHREDDDDVTLPSWRQLVERVNGRCMSNSPSDGPVHPAETYNCKSSGNVHSQSQPVKHTRFRHDGDDYTDDPVDDVYTTGEYDECRVEGAQGSGECHESNVQVNSGQEVNTTAFMSVNSSRNNAVMCERQRSSAFIQLTPRREMNISDGLNTHHVDVHRADVSDKEVSNSARSERCDDSSVVELRDPQFLQFDKSHICPDHPRSATPTKVFEWGGGPNVVNHARILRLSS